MPWLAKAVSLILVATLATAQQVEDSFFSVPPADAPELAIRGRFSVGVRTIALIHHGQIDLVHLNKSQGLAPVYDRPLTIEVWYPALIPPGQVEETTYQMPAPNKAGVPGGFFSIKDKALRDAPPIRGQQFPLVIVSHGYPGSRFFMTYLTSNLASKGYVVAAIDHSDSVFGNVKEFDSTLLNRSLDQLFTIAEIERLSQEEGHFLRGLVATQRTAIIGYSMGGYGALISAGAGLNPQGMANHLIPHDYLSDMLAGSPKFKTTDRSRIKAIVAIAPWGQQPPFNSWTKEALAAIRIPTFFVGGDRDDIADFQNGIRPAFERAVNSERYLLVFEGARHNTGGNPPPVDVNLPYSSIQSFDEPVWRKDRITAINQHFISAFLDLYLKGDETRRAYLNVKPVHSNDGVWPAKFGEPDMGIFSAGQDAAGNLFWKGFQRRSALSLEMYHRVPGDAR